MATRRMRRLERRRVHRTTGIATLAAVLGIAVGLALPQSTTAAFVLVLCVASCMAVVTIRGTEHAPMHGLHQVVRPPLRASLSITLESIWSRAVGSAHAIARIRPHPVPLVLDEADDESAAWWGPSAADATARPTALEPVLAAPMRSAHVQVEPGPIDVRV